MGRQVNDLETKLAAAKERLLRLEAKCAAAYRKSESATPGGISGYDSAVLSGIRRKPDHKKDAQRFAAYDREAEAYRELLECQQRVNSLESRIARAKANAPVPFTTEELKAAKLIRTDLGWHKVARVNAKSVTVETDYSWTDRYAIEKVLEVR